MQLTMRNHMTKASVVITLDNVTLQALDIDIDAGDTSCEVHLSEERFPVTVTRQQTLKLNARNKQWQATRESVRRRDGSIKEVVNFHHEIHW